MSFQGSGTLLIKPVSAKLKRDTEFLGKMDPYCVCKVGGQTQRTREHTDAGKYPSWNDSLSFRRTNEYLLEIEVWDKDTVSKDDLVGQGSYALQDIFNKKQISEWVKIQYKGKYSGDVLIQAQWLPDKSGEKNNQQQYQYNPNVVPMAGPGYQPPYYPPPPNYGATYQQPPPNQYAPPPYYNTMAPQQYPNYQPPQQGYQQPNYPQPNYPQQNQTFQPNPQQSYPQQPNYPQGTYPQQPNNSQQPQYPQQQYPQQGPPPQQPSYPQGSYPQQNPSPQQPQYSQTVQPPPLQQFNQDYTTGQYPNQNQGYPQQQGGYPGQNLNQQYGQTMNYPQQQYGQQGQQGQYGQTMPQNYNKPY